MDVRHIEITLLVASPAPPVYSKLCRFIWSYPQIRTVLFDTVQTLLIRSTSTSQSVSIAVSSVLLKGIHERYLDFYCVITPPPLGVDTTYQIFSELSKFCRRYDKTFRLTFSWTQCIWQNREIIFLFQQYDQNNWHLTFQFHAFRMQHDHCGLKQSRQAIPMEQAKIRPSVTLYSLDLSSPNLVPLITSATPTQLPILVKFGWVGNSPQIDEI